MVDTEVVVGVESHNGFNQATILIASDVLGKIDRMLVSYVDSATMITDLKKLNETINKENEK